ncbi:MAG: hypothetical protein ACJAS9_001307 [Polaribacter sp.]|jgi:hypothetical protein
MSQIEDNNSQTEKRVIDALDSSIDDLHPDIRRKLNQARTKALQTKPSNSFFSRPILKVAGVVSFITLIALVSVDINKNELSSSANNIVEIETDFNKFQLEEIELLEQLEFALWMTEENEIASL